MSVQIARQIRQLTEVGAQIESPGSISLAVLTTTDLPTTMQTSTATATGSTSESNTLPTGVTVGLALGLIVITALAIFAVYLILRRRRTSRGPRIDPYAAEATAMANLRPRTSILKRPGGVGVLSSVNDRGTMAGYGWVRLDTDDRASFESTYEYADSTNPPTYGEASHGGARTWTGPSDSSGASGGASTPAPGEGDATAFRVHGTIRNSGGFRKVRGARADAQSASQPGSERGHVLKLRLDPVLTNRAAPLSAGSPSTPTPQSPPTPRASHMSHMPSFRGGELHRYDTFGRRREDTPSTLFDVDDATVQTAIAGQRAGSAWAPTRV